VSCALSGGVEVSRTTATAILLPSSALRLPCSAVPGAAVGPPALSADCSSPSSPRPVLHPPLLSLRRPEQEGAGGSGRSSSLSAAPARPLLPSRLPLPALLCHAPLASCSSSGFSTLPPDPPPACSQPPPPLAVRAHTHTPTLPDESDARCPTTAASDASW
jgi:hypothetical protein